MSATMSARSFARLASPNLVKSPATPRSILKRPAPLPLSPSTLQFSASFSIHVSPSMTSPHVHFPTSAKLAATYATHSPTTYDRTAIIVSPNPLAMPAYRDRVFSPTSGEFVPSQSIDAVLSKANNAQSAPPVKLGPPVPAAAPLAKPAKVAKQSRASVRFQQNLAAKKSTPLPRDDLQDALLRFPRSPYPTAPVSEHSEPRVNTLSAAPAPRVKELKQRPAPLKSIGTETAKVPLSAATEAETAEDRLSRDFWQSVTLEEPSLSAIPENPMSASVVPQFIFGDKDGGLWSPGMPKRTTTTALEPIALSSVLSPLARTSFVRPQDMLSPIPSDPFSSFPSFTAVLSQGAAAEMVAYPPRAATQL